MTDVELIEKRIQLLERNPKLNSQSNCLGTVLFASGKKDFDSRVDPIYLDTFLSDHNLTLIDNPQLYSMLVFVDTEESCRKQVEHSEMMNREHGWDLKNLEKWCRPGISHAGIVVSLNPLRLFHRLSVNGKIYNNETLDSDNLQNYSQHYDLRYCN